MVTVRTQREPQDSFHVQVTVSLPAVQVGQAMLLLALHPTEPPPGQLAETLQLHQLPCAPAASARAAATTVSNPRFHFIVILCASSLVDFFHAIGQWRNHSLSRNSQETLSCVNPSKVGYSSARECRKAAWEPLSFQETAPAQLDW